MAGMGGGLCAGLDRGGGRELVRHVTGTSIIDEVGRIRCRSRTNRLCASRAGRSVTP